MQCPNFITPFVENILYFLSSTLPRPHFYFLFLFFLFKAKLRTTETAQWIKTLTTTLENLSLIPGTNIIEVEREL